MSFAHIVTSSVGSMSVAVAAAIIFGLQIWCSSKRPELKWHRWAAAISFSAIIYAVGIFLEYNTPAGPVNRAGGLLEWTAVIFLVHALYGFVFSRLNIPSRRHHYIAGGVHVLILILLWSTGLFVSDHFITRSFLTLKNPFVEVDIGPLGPAFMLYAFGASINAILLLIRHGKGKGILIRADIWGASFWIILGAHDAAAAMGLPTVRYVMEYGFLGFAVALLYDMFSDYVRTSDALERSNAMLEKELETRKQLTDTLRESEERYRGLIEDAPVGIATLDIKGRFIYANMNLQEMTGYRAEEWLGKEYAPIVHPGDLTIVQEQVRKGIGGQNVRGPYEVRIIKADGEVIWVSLVSKNIYEGKNGEKVLSGFQIFVQDITKRKRVDEALRESEERYRTIIDNTREGIILQDVSGRVLAWNQTAERVFGISEKEAIEHTSTSREWNTIKEDGSPFPGSDHPSMYSLSTGMSCENTVMGVKNALGGVTWININTNPLFRGNSNPYAVVITFSDITERKRAEMELKKSEALHREAQKVAHIGHWELDPDIGTPVWSEEIFHIFGLDPDEGEPSFSEHETYVHPDDWPILDEAVRKAAIDGTPFDLVFRIVKPGGDPGWMHAIGTTTRDEGGNVTKLFGTTQDITAIRRAEEALRESEEKYRSLVESSEDSIYLVDRECKYLFMNRKHMEHLGLQPDNVMGRSYDEFRPEGDTRQFEVKINEVMETGEAYNYVHTSEIDGKYYYRTLSPVFDRKLDIVAVTVVSKDITGLMQAEEDIKRTYDKLLIEHDQRKILSRRLIDIIEKEYQRISMELHDNIGQILTSLKIEIEMIHEKWRPEDRELEASIKAAQERTSQAIRDIKNISRGLRPSMIDALGLESSLRELFNEVRKHLNAEIRFFSRYVPKRFNHEKELALYRIAQEALNNTVKHAKAKNVFINLIKKDNRISMSVEDDGIGFELEKVVKISSEKMPLGLIIMRERATQLDGEFTIESHVGKGTHILVEIPI